MSRADCIACPSSQCPGFRASSPVSVIDAAAWQPWPRFAVTMLAAAVQQRLVTVDQLDEGLRIVGRVRHKQWMRLALRDIAGEPSR